MSVGYGLGYCNLDTYWGSQHSEEDALLERMTVLHGDRHSPQEGMDMKRQSRPPQTYVVFYVWASKGQPEEELHDARRRTCWMNRVVPDGRKGELVFIPGPCTGAVVCLDGRIQGRLVSGRKKWKEAV